MSGYPLLVAPSDRSASAFHDERTVLICPAARSNSLAKYHTSAAAL
jgi:hypothetical protein